MSEEWPARTTCGSPCPRHEHACARSVCHGGWCRDVKQKGDEGCSWSPRAGTSYTIEDREGPR